ncbi:phosphatidate cytidylyltransferase [Zavarzinia compransoris]|uniref:phosphatidate cytidylyltransferase n=1 Tax=Zavarzinia marina TaxID=2911065 RepID=UPI001F30FE14|nr:phosphatidate cytidylyltransferase [Zavarzinia marina]MCF4164597.1 phosphatidate cytidylyltransferase [Zavarzinia marina]
MAPSPPLDSKRPGDLGRRILSGVVLGAVGLAGVHFGDGYFVALIGLVALALVFEWDRITDRDGIGPAAVVHIGFVAAALAAGALGVFPAAMGLIVAGVLASILLARARGRVAVWSGIAVPYVALPCLAMLWLRFDAAAGAALVYWLLASIWATDTGAYVAGRTIGGPRLAPRISPKKTWAGLIGGVVAAVAVGALVALAVGLSRPLLFGLVSGLIGAWSQIGDLCESAMKRHFGVKDSSNLIPGHGGFLDRLDGLLFAAPAAALAVMAGLPA